MANLQLDIVTPERSVFSDVAREVLLPAWEGQLGVLPEHDHLLALLRCGVATVWTADGETRYVVGRGFAEIGPDKVTLLTDSCELASEVDKAQAKADLDQAERDLGEAAFGSEARRQAEIRQEMAVARLDA